MRPIGRQCASGLSLPSSAMRCLRSAAAQGLSGKPPSRPQPMSQNWFALGGIVPSSSGAPAAPPTPASPAWPKPRALRQIPERSGLPSDVLGVGAARFGLPSGVLGARAVGYGGHWADSVGDETQNTAENAIAVDALRPAFTSSLPSNCLCQAVSCEDNRPRKFKVQSGKL